MTPGRDGSFLIPLTGKPRTVFVNGPDSTYGPETIIFPRSVVGIYGSVLSVKLEPVNRPHAVGGPERGFGSDGTI